MPSVSRSRTRTPRRGSTGRAGSGVAGAGTGSRPRRRGGRRIAVLCLLIILPLAGIAAAVGAGVGGSRAGSSQSQAAAPPGSGLMATACAQVAHLAQTAGNNTATPASMLSDMQQAAGDADQAAQADPGWQSMAADIGTLNTMVQSDTGDQTAFTSQLARVDQECGAVTATQGTPATGG